MKSPSDIATPFHVPIEQTINDKKLFDMEEVEELTMADLLGPDHNNGQKRDNNSQSQSNSSRSVDDCDFDEASFLAALDEHEPVGITDRLIDGTVITIESDGIYVDIGGKAPAFMPKKECANGLVANLKEAFAKGSKVEAIVIREQNAEGIVTISYRALLIRRSWEKIQTLKKDGQLIRVRINGSNRGGLTCDFEGIGGFIPYSQLQHGEDTDKLIGSMITATFLEANPVSQKLVLSAKGAITISRLANLEIGQLIEGYVTSIKPYGFFIELGGVSGLLHHSAITNGKLKEPQKLFRQGDHIRALIIELDPSRKRIALNTALLEARSGELLTEKEKVMNEAANRTINARQLMHQQEQNIK
uniref:Putative 30S ribosomal protein S1-like B n=1 Tax=Paulinella longichromatophora TaxID=1708747 RepID=A0A2H4ZQN6_9EUKA|nr:putative 30S ribosomal protein S1-like B [Paulinella longichromatophora]